MTDEDVDKVVAEGRAELRATFDLFDQDHNGRLDAEELSEGLGVLGQPVDAEEAQRLIASVDLDGDGRLSFDEFLRLVEPVPSGLDPEADLREAFRLLDGDSDGFLSVEDVVNAVQRAEGMSPADAHILARLVDSSDDGMLSYDDFRDLMVAAG